MSNVMLLTGDCITLMGALPAGSIQMCVTSPPYFGLRDYGNSGQTGLEPTPDAYVAKMVDVFRAVYRVLRDDGTVWLNLGDTYSSGGRTTQTVQTARRGATSRTEGADACSGKQEHLNGTAMRPPPVQGVGSKQLFGIPWRVALALQADGWYLRQDIIWHKPNPMPESVQDRCTKSHEHIFLLAKQPRYYFDHEAIKEPTTSGDGTRNKRDVWSVTTSRYKGAHFATFPPQLIEPCIKAGAPPGGVVLDPFSGSGTSGVVALQQGRKYIGIELNDEYQQLARKRIQDEINTI